MYSDRPYFGGAPPLSMPRECCPGVDIVHEGLGFWTALIPVATSIVGGAFGGGESTSRSVYYPDAKAGLLHCPGPYNVAEVAAAFGNLAPGSPLRSEARAKLASDKYWAVYGTPTTAREIAGALVAWAHGKKDCKRSSDDLAAGALVARILQAEAERQSTVGSQAPAPPPLVIGSTPVPVPAFVQAALAPANATPLVIGAVALVGLVLFLRKG